MNQKCRKQLCSSNDWEIFLSLLRLYIKNQSKVLELHVDVFDVTFYQFNTAIFMPAHPA